MSDLFLYNLEINNCFTQESLYAFYFQWCIKNKVYIGSNSDFIYHDLIHITHGLGTSPIEETKVLLLQHLYYTNGNRVIPLFELQMFWSDFKPNNVFLWPSTSELLSCIFWLCSYDFTKYTRYTKASRSLVNKAQSLNMYIKKYKSNYIRQLGL